MNSLTARVEELWDENRALREHLRDLGRVERALGRDTVETIVQKENAKAEEEKEDRQRGEMKKI